ncbi:glycosyltransferase [Flavitalea antarctica]
MGKRILHVVASSDEKLGGVTKAVFTLIDGLNSLNLENTIATLDDPGAAYLTNRKIEVTALGPTRTPWQYSERLGSWLEENLSDFNYVIIHGLWLFPNFAVRKSIQHLQSAGKMIPKVFVMPHGMLDPYFQQTSTRKLKAIRNSLYWRFIEKNNVNSFDGLLFTCESEKTLARLPFKGYNPKSETVIGFGIEEPPAHTKSMDEAFRLCWPEWNNSRYMLFLSRIDPKKGVDILIEGYKLYLEKHRAKYGDMQAGDNYIPLKLIIAGPSADGAFLKKLKDEVAKDHGLNENVTFLDMLTGNAKWGAFYNCEVFILPSHQENFGIAVVEALACHKPVLISSKINIFNEIVSGGGGFVEDDTAVGVYELISKFVGLSDEEVQRKGSKARQTYLKEFYASRPSISLTGIL